MKIVYMHALIKVGKVLRSRTRNKYLHVKLHIVNIHQMAYAYCTTQKCRSPIICLRIGG